MRLTIDRPSRGHGKRAGAALAVLAASAAALFVGSATSASAAPAGTEYPASWTVSGNVATGTTPSGIVVTATVTASATFGSASGYTDSGAMILAGSSPSYFPTTTTGALHILVGTCTGSDCGSITYSYSKPVETPVLYQGDVGANTIASSTSTSTTVINGVPTSVTTTTNKFTSFRDTPTTVVGGTISPEGQTSKMQVTNGNTLSMINPAGYVGTTPGPDCTGSTCDTCVTFGCGAYDITTSTPTVTSLTFNFGYDGVGSTLDWFSQVVGVVPAAEAPAPLMSAEVVAPTGGAVVLIGLGVYFARRRRSDRLTQVPATTA